MWSCFYLYPLPSDIFLSAFLFSVNIMLLENQKKKKKKDLGKTKTGLVYNVLQLGIFQT